MRTLLSTSLLLAAISTCVQADQPFDHPRQRNGLSDLLSALEGAQLGGVGAKNGNGGNAAQGNGRNQGGQQHGQGQQGGQAAPKTVTVTEQAQLVASNQTCEAIKTVTKTVSVPGVAAVGTGGLQLSFVTETAFASGPAPTVTVTPLAQFITQMVTVTVNGANAAQPAAETSSVPAGVNPPAGAVGTGGTGSKTAAIIKTSDPTRPNVASSAAAPGVNPPSGAGGTGSTAAIVKTNNPSVGNIPTAAPSAASQLSVGASGAMASGIGTVVAGGACDCSCLCAAGSFPNVAGGVGGTGQAPAAQSPAATTLSTAAIVKSETPAVASQNTPAVAQSQVGNTAALSSSAIVKTGQSVSSAPPAATPQSQVASSSAPSATQPQAINSATLSSTSVVQTTAPAQGTSAAQPGASTLELSVSAPLGQAAALAKPSSTGTAVPDAAQINISTFSLTSSLVLGSLATPNAKA